MQVMSRENYERMLDEIKLLDETLRYIERNRVMLGLEYGISVMQERVTDLKLQRLDLTLKSDALANVLRE